MKAGIKKKQIALELGRSPATIAQEIKRNTGLKGYRPIQAQRLTEQRRPGTAKYRKVTGEVYDWIETLIHQALSPEQVVDYLAKHRGVSLHFETVYQLIYAENAANGDLYKHLRIV